MKQQLECRLCQPQKVSSIPKRFGDNLLRFTVAIPFSDRNKQPLSPAFKICKALISDHYEEPIAGNVSNMTAAILAGINTTARDESDTNTEGKIVSAQFCDHHFIHNDVINCACIITQNELLISNMLHLVHTIKSKTKLVRRALRTYTALKCSHCRHCVYKEYYENMAQMNTYTKQPPAYIELPATQSISTP